MALAALQASYIDDDDNDNNEITTKTNEEQIEDTMAVINDPSFSIMSKIKLNLTPAIAIQVKNKINFFIHYKIHFFFLSSQQIQVVFLI